jgi:peptidoglycan/xylan/chitin deacetylase (PgdA/CDA1 family)
MVLALTAVASAATSATAAGLPNGLRAALPPPVAHGDPADTASPLDLRSASFGQTGRRFELRIRLGGTLPLAGLVTPDPLRSLCLEVEQRHPVRNQRICLRVARSHALTLVRSARRSDGTFGSPRPLAAHVRRDGGSGLVASFTPATAHLTPGRVVWRVSSDWASPPSCVPPAAATATPVAACHDVVPDTGAVAVRVHRAYTVGCLPGGASLRTSGPRSPRRVALTFDDGPGPQTPAVLRILRRARIHATFFELGVQVRLYPGLVRRVLAGGHAIANHTYDHRIVTGLSPADQASELERTQAALRTATNGYQPCLFRPPAGAINGDAVALARRHRLLSVLWTVDPRDWALPGTDAIVARVLGNVRPGAIVLMHDAGGPRAQTVAALPRIIAALRARHYGFATVPELLHLTPAIAWD